MEYPRQIVIDNEAVKMAQEGFETALNNAGEIVKTGTTEEIKMSAREVIEKCRAYRTMVCARYNLR